MLVSITLSRSYDLRMLVVYKIVEVKSNDVLWYNSKSTCIPFEIL